MTHKLLAFLEQQRKLEQAATPGPYHVERVDHDYDEITYEVSSPGKSFHVVFRESDGSDEGVCVKAQSHFYATSRNNYKRLLNAVNLLLMDIECESDIVRHTVFCRGCNMKAQVEALLCEEGE